MFESEYTQHTAKVDVRFYLKVSAKHIFGRRQDIIFLFHIAPSPVDLLSNVCLDL